MSNTGFELVVDADLLKELNSVDDKLQQIAKTAISTQETFNEQMSSMANGSITDLIAKLQTANTTLGNLTGFEKAAESSTILSQGLQSTGDVATVFVTKLSSISDSLNKLYESQNNRGTASLIDIDTTLEEIGELGDDLDGLRQQIVALKRMRSENQNFLFDDTQRKNAKALTTEIRSLQTQVDKLTVSEKAIKKFDSAMALGENTIAQRTNKITRLTQAQEILNKSNTDYSTQVAKAKAEILRLSAANDTALKSTEKLKTSQSKMLDITGQLARQAALVFSVSQLKGYYTKLVQVRGEFELQQKSLQAIMQDKYQADKVWSQIVDLSVRSPFRLSELTTYTKQLAAYRIENEKIFETTTMLADISAGLGVDMQRLILAYGQVKAANYLRGQELRQFSEAGINILGELSDYFSELEGRAISTAEVFEMVSKRMVSFGDVEVVFERLTEAGGIFYNMQEIQAETLVGKMSNLGDAIDIMLNKIGQSNEDALKGGIDAVRFLVENYEEMLYVLKQVAVVGGTFLVVQRAMNVAIKQNTLLSQAKTWSDMGTALKLMIPQIKGATVAQKAWNAANGLAVNGVKALLLSIQGLGIVLKTALPYLLIAGIAELYRQATEASRAAQRLADDLSKLSATDVTALNKQISGYDDLIARLELSNEGSQERRDIISRLNSQYGEYIDFTVTEATTMEQLADAYQMVIERMRERASMMALEKGVQRIEEEYTNKIIDATKDFEQVLSGGFTVALGNVSKTFKPTQEEIRDIYKLAVDEIAVLQKKDASLVDTQDELLAVLTKTSKAYFNIKEEADGWFNIASGYSQAEGSQKVLSALELQVEKNKLIFDYESQIYSQTLKTSREREAQSLITERENKLLLDRQAILDLNLSAFDTKKQLADLQQQYDLDVIDIKAKFYLSADDAQKQRDAIVNWATDSTKDINKAFEDNIKLKFNFDELSPAEQKKLQEQIEGVFITKNIQDQGFASLVTGLEQSYEPFIKAYTNQLEQMNQGLSIDEASLELNKNRLLLIESQGEAIGLQIGTQNKLNDATADSVNQKIAEKYAVEDINRVFKNTLGLGVDLLDKEKSRATLLSETKTMWTTAKAQVDAMVRSQAQGVIIDEVRLGNLKTEVEMLEYRNLLLGGDSLTKTTTSSSTSLVEQQMKLIQTLNKDYETQRRYWADEEAYNRTMLAYREAIAQVKLGDVDAETGEVLSGLLKGAELTDKGVVDLLNLDYFKTAISKQKPTVQLELRKIFGGFQTQLEIDVKTKNLEETARNLDNLFEGYDLTIQMQALGFTDEQMKELFNFDAVSVADLKTKVEDEIKGMDGVVLTDNGLIDLTASSQEVIDEYNSRNAEIAKIEIDAQKERNKKVAEYLRDSLTEREQLEKDYYKKISDIQKSEISEQAKTLATANVTTQYNLDVAELDFKDFKMTDEYIQAFGDLDSYGEATINHLLQIFKDFSKNADLSPETVKTLMDKVNELEDVAINRNPFKTLKNSVNDYIDAIREAKAAQVSLATAEVNLSIAQQEQDAANVAFDNVDTTDLDAYIAALLRVRDANEALKVAETERTAASKKASNADDKKTKALNDAKKGLDKASDAMQAYTSLVNDAISLLTDFAEGLGIALSDEAQAALDGISQGFQVMNSAISLVQSAIAALSAGMLPLLAAGVALAAVFAIINVADAKRQATIDAEMRKVKLLQNAYEDLETQFEQAYTIDELESTSQEMLDNIDDQIAALEKARAAEMDKKNSDQDAIDDYNEQIADLYEQALEQQYELTRELGGIGADEYKSAAQDFVNAWLDAFEETGDGLSGLEEEFEDMVKNMILATAVSKATDAFMAPLFTMIDEAVEGGVTDDEIDALMAEAEKVLPQLSEFLEELYTGLGVTSDSATSDLTGLQNGVQNITEDSASEIIAYMSSLRFEVFRQGTLFDSMLESLQAMASLNNPESSIIYKELVSQTTLLRSIDSRLADVIKSGGNGGFYVDCGL